MTDPMRIDELRELFLRAPEAISTRVLAAAVGVGVIVLVLWLVRTRRLREEFTPLWIVAALGLAAVSFSFELLRFLTVLLGAWTPSSTVFFLALSFLGLVSLAYAVRLSRMVVDVKNLAQEVALLRARLEDLEARDPSAADQAAAPGTAGDPPPRSSAPDTNRSSDREGA